MTTTACEASLLFFPPSGSPLNLNNNKNGIVENILEDQEQPGFTQLYPTEPAPEDLSSPELTNGIDCVLSDIFELNEFHAGDIDDFEGLHQKFNDFKGQVESSSRFQLMKTSNVLVNSHQNEFGINTYEPERLYQEIGQLGHQDENSSRLALLNNNAHQYGTYFAYYSPYNANQYYDLGNSTRAVTDDNDMSDYHDRGREFSSPWQTENDD